MAPTAPADAAAPATPLFDVGQLAITELAHRAFLPAIKADPALAALPHMHGEAMHNRVLALVRRHVSGDFGVNGMVGPPTDADREAGAEAPREVRNSLVILDARLGRIPGGSICSLYPVERPGEGPAGLFVTTSYRSPAASLTTLGCAVASPMTAVFTDADVEANPGAFVL
jgi:hypothetical protein